jgi:hypothetical protein
VHTGDPNHRLRHGSDRAPRAAPRATTNRAAPRTAAAPRATTNRAAPRTATTNRVAPRTAAAPRATTNRAAPRTATTNRVAPRTAADRTAPRRTAPRTTNRVAPRAVSAASIKGAQSGPDGLLLGCAAPPNPIYFMRVFLAQTMQLEKLSRHRFYRRKNRGHKPRRNRVVHDVVHRRAHFAWQFLGPPTRSPVKALFCSKVHNATSFCQVT